MDTSTFAALPPVPETVNLGGESLDIVPLKLGELPAFARALGPLAAKLTPEPDWLRLLSEEGESLIHALSIACRRPASWVEGLALDEAIRLAEIVFEANADFFIRRVVPEITRVTGNINRRIAMLPIGATPSSAS